MPMASVAVPNVTQAVRHPQPVISNPAISGRTVSPIPWSAPNRAKASGRRRTNQLEIAVEVPSSNGLEKTALPGT